jgi:FixJ family two-component response regulator
MDRTSTKDVKGQKGAVALVAVVDDDELTRKSTRRLLLSFGLQSEIFDSAEDFLQSSRVEEIACLLLDMKMSGMGGLALQSRLVEDGRFIPIIFVSAQASEDEERRALQAGARSFLRKPVSSEALLLAIRDAIKF